MNIIEKFEKIDKKYWLIIGFSTIGLVGIIDYLTGRLLSFSAFYMIPIVLITWQTGRRFGIIATVASVAVWLIARILSGGSYPGPIYYVLNTLIEWFSLLIVSILLSAIKDMLDREKKYAQIDPLTGAMNSRSFINSLQMEIRRSNRYRHPFTIAYFDVDDFKNVNDQLGHTVGDDVLCTIVEYAQKHIRKTDVIARLGGDEFAVLLTETRIEDAPAVIMKIQDDIMLGLQEHHWAVTISIGVLTCVECIDSVKETDEIIRVVDDLMYSVKRNGKNSIKFSTFTGVSVRT